MDKTKEPVIAIFDHFKGQMTEKVFKVLEKYHIHLVLIPPGCTDRLQPMDVSINRAAKAFLERQFQDWYAQQVMENMKSAEQLAPVNLSSIEMIHVGSKWFVQMFEHISDNPHLLINGFIATGITTTISDAIADLDAEEYDLSSCDDDDSDEDEAQLFSFEREN